MGDHICPICGTYGISLREKVKVRLYGQVLTCRACGVRLTVGFWESVMSLIPLLLSVGLGLLLNNMLALVICAAAGLAASWYWSIRYVPLIPLDYGRTGK